MTVLTVLFPVLAIFVSIAAYLAPEPFAPQRGAIVPLLTVIMFAMGLTLAPADFRRVLARARLIGLGVALQYTVMPVAAFAIGHGLALPKEVIAGLVLLGACPGGTASNVICYLAKADVALSVSLTMASTALAVVATPALTWLFVGQSIPVDVGGMLESLARIVVAPVALGVLLNHWWGARLAALRVVLPAIAIGAILVVIAIVVALNRDSLTTAGPIVFAAVVLHNGCGLLAGYWLPKLMGLDRRICRTLAIEVGMQNSGLATALAVTYFSALTALPGALFSVWHILSGSVVASIWGVRWRRTKQVPDEPAGWTPRPE